MPFAINDKKAVQSNFSLNFWQVNVIRRHWCKLLLMIYPFFYLHNISSSVPENLVFKCYYTYSHNNKYLVDTFIWYLVSGWNQNIFYVEFFEEYIPLCTIISYLLLTILNSKWTQMLLNFMCFLYKTCFLRMITRMPIMAMNRIHTSKFPITFIVGWNIFAWHGQLRCDAKTANFFSAGLTIIRLTDICW